MEPARYGKLVGSFYSQSGVLIEVHRPLFWHYRAAELVLPDGDNLAKAAVLYTYCIKLDEKVPQLEDILQLDIHDIITINELLAKKF